MQIGIFTTTFARPTLAETLDAVIGHGLRDVQFDLSSAGLSSMPEQIDPQLTTTIRLERERGIIGNAGTRLGQCRTHSCLALHLSRISRRRFAVAKASRSNQALRLQEVVPQRVNMEASDA